ncbi:MAG: AAA family ATPase [Hydrogenophaga sp.]
MYTAFFGLQQAPFSIAPDPRYLFMSERHREALAHLLYGIESGGGFVLLTGEIGAGKTTVCRRFLEQIPEHARVAYIFNPKLTAAELLQTVCHEFGVVTHHQAPGAASIKEYLDPLNAHLLQSHARGEHNLLIIDEAQALAVEVLEQLRLLTNLETSQRKLLQIILIGQPELRQMLARPELEQLSQRVIARFHLGALTETETHQYVAHRMAVAGWQGDTPFAADALKNVHRLTGGVPRRVNLLCDRALLGAYASSTQRVTSAMVQQAAREVFDWSNSPRRPRFGWQALTGVALTMTALAVGSAWAWRSHWPLLSSVALAPPSVPAQVAPSASEAAVAATVAALSADLQPFNKALSNPQRTAAQADAISQGLPPSSGWIAQEDQAFSALAPLWGTTLSAEQPCTEALEKGLQCYRTPRMTGHGLRQMNRPALLKLQQPGQGSGYVLATAIEGDTLELRDAQQRRWQVPISALDKVWQGYYASLWRTPPGQNGHLSNGYGASSAPWMEDSLTRLQAAGRLTAQANTLKAKVETFQRANGIEVNGIASPTTLILLNQAIGVEEPRLAANTR